MQKVQEFFKIAATNIYKILKRIGLLIWDLFLRIIFSIRDLGIAVWHGIQGLGRMIKKFHKRFMDSNIWTKCSHFVMGVGNFANKQFVKGALFLSIQILFIVFLIASPKVNGTPLGAKAIPNFFELGKDHGMPITDDAIVIEDTLTEVYARTDDEGEELFSAGYVLNFREDSSTVQQLVRFPKLYEKIKIYNSESPDTNFLISRNNGQYKEYDKKLLEYLVYDNRYGTRDIYGYGEYTANQEFEVKGGSATTFLIISTTEKLKTSNEVISENDFIGCFESNKPITVGVFYDKNKYEDNQESYEYYIILKSSPGYGNITVSLKGDAFLGAKVSKFSLNSESGLVTTTVDKSFLMMLFGLVTFLIIALYLLAYTVNIASAYKAQKEVEEGKTPTTFIEDLKSLLDERFHMTLLTPALILIAIFTILPTVLMILISFTNMDTPSVLSGSMLIDWVGIGNFVDLFGGDAGNEIAKEVGKNFGRILAWTFEWAFVATFSCYFGGIFLALLINRKDVKLKKLWRTVFILTIAIPQFITLLIMRNLLTTTGPINSMLLSLGIVDEGINFLQMGSGVEVTNKGVWLARGTVLVVNLYIGIPYTMLMTSGILMNIPSDLYEAATIDGANKWQMFRKITLPYVIFVTTPYLIQSFIGNITSFNTIFLLTGGGPTDTTVSNTAGYTDLLVTWLYKLTIENSKYNAGSIIGILTFMITASITLICYRNSKAYKEEDTFQ